MGQDFLGGKWLLLFTSPGNLRFHWSPNYLTLWIKSPTVSPISSVMFVLPWNFLCCRLWSLPIQNTPWPVECVEFSTGNNDWYCTESDSGYNVSVNGTFHACSEQLVVQFFMCCFVSSNLGPRPLNFLPDSKLWAGLGRRSEEESDFFIITSVVAQFEI